MAHPGLSEVLHVIIFASMKPGLWKDPGPQENVEGKLDFHLKDCHVGSVSVLLSASFLSSYALTETTDSPKIQYCSSVNFLRS